MTTRITRVLVSGIAGSGIGALLTGGAAMLILLYNGQPMSMRSIAGTATIGTVSGLVGAVACELLRSGQVSARYRKTVEAISDQVVRDGISLGVQQFESDRQAKGLPPVDWNTVLSEELLQELEQLNDDLQQGGGSDRQSDVARTPDRPQSVHPGASQTTAPPVPVESEAIEFLYLDPSVFKDNDPQEPTGNGISGDRASVPTSRVYGGDNTSDHLPDLWNP